MSYLTNDLPATFEEWTSLWNEIIQENELTTDRGRYQFLTQMVMGITSVMAEMPDTDDTYQDWRTFVNLVFEEWQGYDNLLNNYDD